MVVKHRVVSERLPSANDVVKINGNSLQLVSSDRTSGHGRPEEEPGVGGATGVGKAAEINEVGETEEASDTEAEGREERGRQKKPEELERKGSK